MRMDDQEIIVIGDQRYIRAGSSLADDRRRVLLSGDPFAVFDRSGDFQPIGSGEFGLFHCDTRYLSAFELRMNGQRPLLLSSSIRDDNAVLAVDLTNSEMRRGDQLIRHGTVHIYRSKFLRPACCFERIRIENYGTEIAELTLSLQFGAAIVLELRRLPELFCGFPRRPQTAPTLYPVACSPQAWAAGSVFLLLQSCLGLHISAENSRITFYYPTLPETVEKVRLKNLTVGDGFADLVLTRDRDAVSVGVSKRIGNVEVSTIS